MKNISAGSEWKNIILVYKLQIYVTDKQGSVTIITILLVYLHHQIDFEMINAT